MFVTRTLYNHYTGVTGIILLKHKNKCTHGLRKYRLYSFRLICINLHKDHCRKAMERSVCLPRVPSPIEYSTYYYDGAINTVRNSYVLSCTL